MNAGSSSFRFFFVFFSSWQQNSLALAKYAD